ncbi:MAG: S8 family serine peptidase [Pseudomonadota bacterium]
MPWTTNGPTLKRSAVPGELLVANITPNLVRQADALGIAVDKGKVSLGSDTTLTRITFSKSRSSNTMIGLVSQFISGENVYPNHRYHHYDPANGQARGGWETSIPDKGSQACATSECYGSHVIGWSDHLTRCAVGRRIGVIDSAIDRDHATFSSQHIQTKRLHASASTKGAARHGTGVLAILAGSRSSKTPGLVPDAKFFHVDAFFRSKNGALTSDTLSLVKALGMLRDWRAEIVNLSLVGPKDQLVEHALQQLSDQGAVLVSAAGNGGPAGGTSYPAGYKNVIAVTAIDKHSKAYALANRGAFVDVAAPGVDIWTALPGQRQGLQSGTSFAVPFATAVVAAMYNGFLRTDRLTVLGQLPTSDLGRKGKDPIYGAGLIQAPAVCHEQPIVAASARQKSRYAALGVRSLSAAGGAAADAVETAGWRDSAFTQND